MTGENGWQNPKKRWGPGLKIRQALAVHRCKTSDFGVRLDLLTFDYEEARKNRSSRRVRREMQEWVSPQRHGGYRG